jgi:hypothetical protein
MTWTADPRIDAYIDALPDWQQAICRQVRDLVHAADPEVTETIKRTRQPYFVLEGNICALLAAKDHVNIFLYDGGNVPPATRRESSLAATRTSSPAPWPSTRARPSTPRPCWRCSATSSPTTGPAAGPSATSNADPPPSHHAGANGR